MPPLDDTNPYAQFAQPAPAAQPSPPPPQQSRDDIIDQAGTEHGVDPDLMRALIHQESGGNPNIESSAGAVGLTQLMPETARELGVTDRRNEGQNIRGGTRYLAQQLQRFGGNPYKALAAYNAGPNGNWGPGQEDYANSVMQLYEQLHGKRQAFAAPATAADANPYAQFAAPPPAQPAQPAQQPIVFGDSLAAGIQTAGKFSGYGRVSANPSDVMAQINNATDAEIAGKPVILSSGISNDIRQWPVVERQIAELKRRGAGPISLVGVGSRPDLAPFNAQLGKLAEANGVRFMGPVAGQVHPAAGYAAMTQTAQAPPAAAPAGAVNPYAQFVTPPPAQAAQPAQPAQQPTQPTPEDTGLIAAGVEGAKTGFRGGAETYQALTGGKPGVSTPNILAAQPITWADYDPRNWHTLLEKAAYSLAASGPAAAAFLAGSAPFGGPDNLLGLGSGAVAAAVASGFTSLGPNFGAELKATPDDPKGAFNRAFENTGVGAFWTGVGFATFGIMPFKSALMNMTFQAFGVQPAVGVAEKATTNVMQGKPAEEGVLEGVPGAIVGTLAPAVAFGAAHRVLGAISRGRPVASEDTQQAAADMAAAGQPPPGDTGGPPGGGPPGTIPPGPNAPTGQLVGEAGRARTPEQAALDEETAQPSPEQTLQAIAEGRPVETPPPTGPPAEAPPESTPPAPTPLPPWTTPGLREREQFGPPEAYGPPTPPWQKPGVRDVPLDPLHQRRLEIADEWQALGDPEMAKAIRMGAAGGTTPENIAFLEQRLAEKQNKIGGTAPKPQETFSINDFFANEQRWKVFGEVASPEARAFAEETERQAQLLVDRMNERGLTLERAHIESTEGAALKQEFMNTLGAFSRYMKNEAAVRKGYQNASEAKLADARNELLKMLRPGEELPPPAPAAGSGAPPQTGLVRAFIDQNGAIHYGREGESVSDLQSRVYRERPDLARGVNERTAPTPEVGYASPDGKFLTAGEARAIQEGAAPPEPAAPPVAPPQEPTAVPPTRPAGYGANNKLVTNADVEAIRARLRAKSQELRAGIDPEMMLDGARLAIYHIEAGTRAFADFAREMVSDVGEWIRPYLPGFYENARRWPGVETEGMSPPDEVDRLAREGAQGGGGGPEIRPVDQPGGGETSGTGGGDGRPPGTGTGETLEPRPPADVPGTGAGPGEETGAGPRGAEVPGDAGLPEGGMAPTGRGGTGAEGVAPEGAGGRPGEPDPVRPNFHVDNPEDLIGGTPKVRFGRNRAAIEALNAIEEEQRPPTQDELKAMAGYIGWGSFGQELFQGAWEKPVIRKGWEAEQQWLRDHLGEEAWKSAQRSILNAHYTDPPTVQAMWDMARAMGFKGGRVLEPSMGIGNFFGLMPRDIMAASNLTGIELDRTTARMAKLLYPEAGVHNKGYQESRTPDNFYDMVIGNWPFAAQSPPDRRYAKLQPTLHDYFFLKALDQTRPGGIVMGITSAGTMDKANRSTRIELAKKGELIAAFRLPTGAFEKYAGTAVVTDLLVFRKRAETPANVMTEPWINSGDMATPNGNEIRVNDFFRDNPDNVLGTLDWGHGTTSPQPGMIVHRPEDLMQRLVGLAGRVPEDGYQPRIRGNEPRFITNNSADRQNSITIGPDNELYQVQGERLVRAADLDRRLAASKPAERATNETQVRGMIGLRRAYGGLIDAERDGAPNVEALRAELAGQFAAFREQHGPIKDSTGWKILNKLADPSADALASLEREDGTPSRILTEPTMRAKRNIENPSITEAYILGRNESKTFDIDRVAALSGMPPDVVAQELLRQGAILRTPGGGFEPADTYLSGNVRRKLHEAQDAVSRGEDMAASVEALTNALPKTVPYFQIEAKLGAPWTGEAAYRDFIAHMLGLSEDQKAGVQVRFAGARWQVTLEDHLRHRVEAQTNFGTDRYRFDKLVKAAMGNTTIRLMTRDLDGNEVYDKASSDEANGKVQAMREAFSDWAWADPERRVALENAYNETMNAIAAPRYDGSFMDMSGMALRRGDDPFSLRTHQMNAIWRGVVLGRGLFAHEVGTGKSYTMAGVAVEGRRYGVHSKPLVFAHNANSEAVYREFRQMYPGGKFLYLAELPPNVIGRALHSIANEDWDAVIMPHSLIDRMALSRDTLMDLARDQIAALENEAMEAAREDGVALTPEMMDDPEAMRRVRSITAKELVRQRERILAMIEAQALRSSREGAVPFENLGIDAVIVDEAHEFKKPPIATRMKLRGLNTKTSDRSLALNFLTGYVKKQRNGDGVYLFTGTPVTNTLNEVFNMGRYFMDDQMGRAGVGDWDTWFNTFADAKEDVEVTAAGTIEPVKRLAKFNNIDELVRQMSEFTDVVQSKDMPEFTPRATPARPAHEFQLDLPALHTVEPLEKRTLQSPNLTPEDRDFLENGRQPNPQGLPYKRIIRDVGEMSPEQKEMMAHFRQLAQEWKDAPGGQRREWMQQGDEHMSILVEQNAANASLDARLYDPNAPDDPGSKTNRVVRNVLKHYLEPGAGQAIFVDRGYGKTKAGRGREYIMVNDLVDKLVAGGIPRSEIELVTGKVKADRKSEIAKRMNDGRTRVVIGLSSTLGVGVNMQRQLRAMHHMDAPWMPGELEQRNGRGERQGNEWNTVLEYRYITEGIDGRRWQVLAAKDKFIKDYIGAFNDKSGKRLGTLEGDAADISDGPDILQTLSEATGDPRIMVREKLKSDVAQLERRERQHTMGVADARQSARMMRSMLTEQNARKAADQGHYAIWQEAAARAQAAAEAAGDTHRWYETDIGGEHPRTGDEIQTALDNQTRQLASGDNNRLLGTINGHEIRANWSLLSTEPNYYMGSPAERAAHTLLAAPTMGRIINAIAALRQRATAGPTDFEQRIARMEAAGQAEFIHTEKLWMKREQLARLEADMQANPDPAPSWLRHGAPVDSEIYVNGQPRTVRGHAVDDDYRLMTDEGPVSYLDATDANGQRVYDVHPQPGGAPEALEGQASLRGPDEKAPTAPAYDEEARARLADAGRRLMVASGLPESVGLKLAHKIAAGTGAADAGYTHGMITLALDTPPHEMPGKLFHEVVHALMDPGLGLLKEGERQALYRGADRWLNEGNNRADLAARGYDPAQMRDEAVARMGEAALARGLAPPAPYARLLNFLARIGQLLRGQGFRTADDVFNSVLRGERRTAPAGPAAEGEAFARRPRPGLVQNLTAGPAFDVLRDKTGLRKLGAEIRAVFAPTSMRGARPTEAIIREETSRAQRSFEQVEHNLTRVRGALDRLPVADQLDATENEERRQPHATPEIATAMGVLRGELDHWTGMVQSLGRGYLARAIDGYMGHIWTPQSLARAQAASAARQPLRGPQSFMKRRFYSTQREGMANGLEPITTNPIDMQLVKLREMQKFYHGTRVADEMKAQGIAKWVRAGEERHAEDLGWVKLDDRVFQPRLMGQANPAGFGSLKTGDYYAPEPAARLFNNYMSRGLAGSAIYDAFRASGSALNSLQLGFSGFHAMFETIDAMTSTMALGFQQLGQGKIGKGAANILLGTTPLAMLKAVREGAKVRSAWLDPQGADPVHRRVADLMNIAGQGINMPGFYRTNASGSFFKSWADLKNPASIFHDSLQMLSDAKGPVEKAVLVPLKIAGRVIDTINEPLMGAFVPRVKAGVFSALARNWEESHPNATPAERSAAMTQFADSVDNRMGQLRYDNIFWNKTMKDLAFIMMRSVGWNLGTVRELGGGVVDGTKFVADIARGRAPAFTTRMAYTMAMPAVVGLWGSILTYVATGHGPQSYLDMFFPPTGNQDPNGDPERRSIPSYIKDVIEYFHAPVQTVLNKTHPLLETLNELRQNKDYYGTPVYNPLREAGAVPQYLDYMLNQAIPFSWRGFSRLHNQPQPAPMLDQMLAFWGIQPAPASIVHPERAEARDMREYAKGLRKLAREPGRINIFSGP